MEAYKTQILTDIDRIKSKIHKEIMLSIVDYAFKFAHITEIGIGDVMEFTSNEYSEIDVLLSLQQLCLLKYPLLEVRYEFRINEDTYYTLSKSGIKEAEKTGYLIHPHTGELLSMDIYRKNVYMFFKIIKENKV